MDLGFYLFAQNKKQKMQHKRVIFAGSHARGDNYTQSEPQNEEGGGRGSKTQIYHNLDKKLISSVKKSVHCLFETSGDSGMWFDDSRYAQSLSHRAIVVVVILDGEIVFVLDGVGGEFFFFFKMCIVKNKIKKLGTF